MKSLLITLIGTLTIGTVLPAFAGPDFQVLQQSRKAHAARVATVQTSGNSTAGTSQSGNQESQHDKMMKQCMEMMQKS